MKRTIIAAALVSLSFFGMRAQTPAPSTLPLVQPSGLSYVGSFRVPLNIHSGGKANAGFEYGGTAIGFDAARNGLYMVGHDWDQFVGEISIPTPATGPLSSLPRATLLQPLVDVTEGTAAQVNPGDPNPIKVGGVLTWLGKLIVTYYAYYDGNGGAKLSHFVSGLDLSVKGDVTGPFQVGTPITSPDPNQKGALVSHNSAGFVAGPMAVISPEWRTTLGGAVLTSQCCLAIVSRTSWGPSGFAIDPAQLGVAVPLPAKPLVAYPAENPLAQWASSSTLFNGTTDIRGVVFPAGTRSVLYFGKIGTGPWCYGAGTPDQTLDGTLTSDGVTRYCYDPINFDKGTHAFPYGYQVWAYDANDLAKAAAGQIAPWFVRPYATWTLPLPYPFANYSGLAATYDPSTGRVFLSQMRADGAVPVVHVFTVSTVTPPPPPPLNTDCVVTWSQWSAWTPTATDQVRSRTATVITPQSGTGAACPVSPDVEHQPLPPPDVDCDGTWSQWADTATDQIRTFTVTTPQSGAGLACPASPEHRPLPPPPPPIVVLSTMMVKTCTLVLEDDPPDATGGWSVQFRRNGVSHGTIDATAPYTRAATVTAGAYSVSAIWTKVGQPTVTRAPVATSCP